MFEYHVIAGTVSYLEAAAAQDFGGEYLASLIAQVVEHDWFHAPAPFVPGSLDHVVGHQQDRREVVPLPFDRLFALAGSTNEGRFLVRAAK